MKLEIIVRSLQTGDERLWVSLGVPEAEKEQRYLKLKSYLSANPNLPPEQYLLVFCRDRLVGKMSGVVESIGYIITGIHVAEDMPRTTVADALLESVNHLGLLQALSWAREGDASWRELLKQVGFVNKQDKTYYRRKIRGFISPYSDPLIYRSMDELGEAAILQIYRETYSGNLNRNFNNESPEADFRSHIESAGTLFDPKGWFAVFEGDTALGIVLPQRFRDAPNDGTLMSIGLIPGARNKGYGKIVHAKGLEVLSKQGATDYIGSTDVMNEPMKKIFEKNGCGFIGIRTTHEKEVKTNGK